MDTSRTRSEPRDNVADLSQLTQLLLTTDSFDAFLTELVNYTSSQTEHACSITVRSADRDPYTVVSTDELTTRLDEHQYANGRGPCLEALSTGVPVFVMDMANEPRWPPFPAQVAALGVRSSMSYPLLTGAHAIGALNMYAFKEVSPDVGMHARAAQLADRAAGALAVASRISEQKAENANLHMALSSRSVIDQAIGVLMAQQQCSRDDAFALLRRASQGRNIKLREVAAQIVAGVQRRIPGSPGGRY